jgi:hypothetical protein
MITKIFTPTYFAGASVIRTEKFGKFDEWRLYGL